MEDDGNFSVGEEKANVYIVVVNHMLRNSIRRVIEASPLLTFCGEASSSRSSLKEIATCVLNPEVVLFDIYNPDRDIAFIPRLKELNQEIRILGISGHYHQDNVRRALTSGASGFLMKDEISVDLLPKAIHDVKMGTVFISTKAHALLDGESTEAIG